MARESWHASQVSASSFLLFGRFDFVSKFASFFCIVNSFCPARQFARAAIGRLKQIAPILACDYQSSSINLYMSQLSTHDSRHSSTFCSITLHSLGAEITVTHLSIGNAG